MANVTDLRIDIASEFTGAKAFKKAESSTANLERSIKNLGRTLGLTLSSAAIVAFGKSAANAFIQDAKAAAVLANTMKNLGLEMSAPTMERYIQSLEMATGVVDDQLRPAMQTLLQVTGSVTQSQKILAQSIEVSRATGVELTTVAQDLGQAFVGNTRGLRKYSLGLTQTELKAASFADIQARMTKLFGGANEAYLGTYAGQMERLGVAAGEAKEAIGKGLVGALAGLNGGGAGGLEKTISMLTAVSDGIGTLIERLGTGVGGIGKLLTGDIRGAIGVAKGVVNGKPYTGAIPSISAMVQQAEQAKAEKAALLRAKELQKTTVATTKSKKEQLALEKAKANLAKAQANFDITKINLLAALKGKVSEEDRKRLLALQAIEENNGELALKYISQLDYQRKLAAEAEEERLRKLAEAEKARQEALLASIRARMDAIQEMMDKVQRKIAANAAEAAASLASMVAGYSQIGQGIWSSERPSTTTPVVPYGYEGAYGGNYYSMTGRDPMPVSLNISLDGQAFQSAVVGAVNNASASGTGLAYTQTAVRY